MLNQNFNKMKLKLCSFFCFEEHEVKKKPKNGSVSYGPLFMFMIILKKEGQYRRWEGRSLVSVNYT